jgi:cytidyltransferase-like protein
MKVLTVGVFDGLHAGHVRYLEAARKLGEAKIGADADESVELIVVLAVDEVVDKGPGRPVFKYDDRRAALLALSCVDRVVENATTNTVPHIIDERAALYVRGDEYDGALERLQGAAHDDYARDLNACDTVGTEVAFVKTMLGYASSTDIARRTVIPANAAETVGAIRDKYGWGIVLDELSAASQVKATVVGDKIKDVYEYVDPVGASPKDMMVTWRHTGDRLAVWGGASVVAAQARATAGRVNLVTPENGHITKTRMVHRATGAKVFSYSDGGGPERVDLTAIVHDPLLIVADFGHGYITDEDADNIAGRHGGSLALTVQANSLNFGHNILTKWPRADYVVVDDGELRLAAQDRTSPLEDIMGDIMRQMRLHTLVVTQGGDGAIGMTMNGDKNTVMRVPALTDRPVDRLGAGDAFLGASAPLWACRAPLPIVLLVGSGRSVASGA